MSAPEEPYSRDGQAEARAVAAGVADAVAFAAANPGLPGLPKEYRLHVFLYGRSARGNIEQWISAARAAGACITELVDKDYGGIAVQFGPVRWHVRAHIEDLGGELPKRVRGRSHRPLLGDEPTGGAG